MGSNYTKIFYRDYEKLQKEHEKALEKQRTQDDEIRRLQRLYELERKENERLAKEKKQLAKEKEELEAKTEALKREAARLNGILNMDGNNSGTPTSRTALHNKEKGSKYAGKEWQKRGWTDRAWKSKTGGVSRGRSNRRRDSWVQCVSGMQGDTERNRERDQER